MSFKRSSLLSCLAVLGLFSLLVPSNAQAQNAPVFAILAGGFEEPGPGDSNGIGSATLIFPTATRICFAILVTGIDAPTVAHVHRGAPGVAGPPVITLTHPVTGSPGTSSGCAIVAAALATEIRTFPIRFYINVHTGAFPGGALRGQLF